MGVGVGVGVGEEGGVGEGVAVAVGGGVAGTEITSEMDGEGVGVTTSRLGWVTGIGAGLASISGAGAKVSFPTD